MRLDLSFVLSSGVAREQGLDYLIAESAITVDNALPQGTAFLLEA